MPDLQESSELNWDQIMLDWEKSGLTKPEFCRQQNIAFNSFSYQRNKRHTKNKPMSFSKISISSDPKPAEQ